MKFYNGIEDTSRYCTMSEQLSKMSESEFMIEFLKIST